MMLPIVKTMGSNTEAALFQDVFSGGGRKVFRLGRVLVIY